MWTASIVSDGRRGVRSALPELDVERAVENGERRSDPSFRPVFLGKTVVVLLGPRTWSRGSKATLVVLLDNTPRWRQLRGDCVTMRVVVLFGRCGFLVQSRPR